MKKKRQLSEMELSSFCEQLHMVITSGMPAYQGISLLLDDAEDKPTRALLTKIYEPMELGESLHQALADTGVFPPYMLHMLEIGEETGRLEEVLKSLAEYYDREYSLKTTLKRAVRYPLFMFFLMFSVIIVLITKVLPIFSDIYESLGSDLSGSAHVLMKVSVLLNNYMVILIILVLLLIAASYVILHFGYAEKLLGKRPVFTKIASSRFANCLYLTIASGLDAERGLELASQVISNPYISKKLQKCSELLSQGTGVADALFLSELFPKMFSSWIRIGYNTGELDPVLKRICDTYQEETDATLQHTISLLEPTLVILLSIIVGLILVSFLLPLLGILSSMG